MSDSAVLLERMPELIRRVCDKALIRLVMMFEAQIPDRRLMDEGFPRIEWRYDPTFRTQESAITELRTSWKHLLTNFGRRVEDLEVHLFGVQVHPQDRPTAEILPNIWGSQMRFDPQRDAIEVLGRKYVAVRGSTALPPDLEFHPAVRNRDGSAAKDWNAPYAAISGQAAIRSPGRPRTPVDDLIALARQFLPERAGSNKKAAGDLHQLFLKHFPERQPPSERTIESHVNRIYAALSDESHTP